MNLSLRNRFLQEVWNRLQIDEKELRELGFQNQAQLSKVLAAADTLSSAIAEVQHKGSHTVSLTIGAILRDAADKGIQPKELCQIHKDAVYSLGGIMHAILESDNAHRMPEKTTIH